MKHKNLGMLTPEYMAKLKALAEAKLLNIRFKEGTTIAILKYSKRAFWKAAWKEHPELTETRGMIVDWATGRIIAMPFTKVFNHGENQDTLDMFKDDEYVVHAVKVNGFLAIATYDKESDQFIFTSSGTFDSEFAGMARQFLDIERVRFMLIRHPNLTFMFELCHRNDPHIVVEDEGAHLIGAREKFLGSPLLEEEELDALYNHYLKDGRYMHRPLWSNELIFKTVIDSRRWWEHEGYMVRGIGDQRCLKIKSTYYLTLKFLSRSNKVDAIWDDPQNVLKTVDEDFHEIINALPSVISKQAWYEKTDQERLYILKGLLR